MCGEKGHKAVECPKKVNSLETGEPTAPAPVRSLALGGMFKLFSLDKKDKEAKKEDKEGFQEVKNNKKGKKKKTTWKSMPLGKPYNIVREWNRYGRLGKDWKEEEDEEDSLPELEPSSSEEDGNKKKEGKKKKLKTKKSRDREKTGGGKDLFELLNFNAAGKWTGEWEELEITVDSGAAESVAPESFAKGFQLMESEGSKAGQIYTTADGTEIPNMGEKKMEMWTKEGNPGEVTFQIAKGVVKPLGSVKKMCQAGNQVVFDDSGSYVVNKATGKRTWLEEKNGIYIMKVQIPKAPVFAGLGTLI